MAKAKGENGKAQSAQTKGNGEQTVSAYFRKVFVENPKLLRTRSNEELLRRWLADHPGETEVPKNVKAGLQNIKSVLRSSGRKRQARRAEAAAAAPAPGEVRQPQKPARAKSQLEMLEEQIDECLTAAKALDREGLESVIQLLRRARNEVVWKLGQ